MSSCCLLASRDGKATATLSDESMQCSLNDASWLPSRQGVQSEISVSGCFSKENVSMTLATAN